MQRRRRRSTICQNMTMSDVLNLGNQLITPENLAKISLFLTSFQFLHIRFIRNPQYPRMTEVVAYENLVPQGVEIVERFEDGQLISEDLMIGQGGILVGLVHDGKALDTMDNMPFKPVAIPDSAGLKDEEAVNRGVNLKLFTK